MKPMAKKTNGTPRDRFDVDCSEFPELGYVIFQAGEKRPPDPSMLPDVLGKSVTNWIKQRPEIAVMATLPIVKDGQTVAIHVWYEEG